MWKHTDRHIWGYAHTLQQGLSLTPFFVQVRIILVKCIIFQLVRLET